MCHKFAEALTDVFQREAVRVIEIRIAHLLQTLHSGYSGYKLQINKTKQFVWKKRWSLIRIIGARNGRPRHRGIQVERASVKTVSAE